MGQYFTRVFGQVSAFFGQLSGPKKTALGATALAISAGIIFMFIWASEQTLQPLMTNLNPEDAASVMRVLREKSIPFTVDSSGRNISVPPESMHQLRIELATLGLPQTGVIGYEVFDKQSLGATTFVQKLNQKRALEGEIMRTINTIKGVKRTRVHLAIPQKSTFVEDQKKPTASVVLDLEPGNQLSEKQIFGIGNLVSRAVEGLDVDDVVIVDSVGKILSRNSGDSVSSQTMGQLEFRNHLEAEIAKRIETIVGRVVGEGRVTAKVNAEVDFSQVAETSTTYDSEGAALRSRESDTKTMEGSRPGPVGLAGAASNQPGAPAAGTNQVRSDTKTNREISNYNVPQTVRQTKRPSWQVQKLSVAVVVDGKTVKTTGENGEVLTKIEPWSADKLTELQKIVATTVGIDLKRGDTLEIRNMDFAREDFEEAERALAIAEQRRYVTNMITYLVIGLVIVLFFLLVVRPFIKWLTDNTIESVDSFLPQTIEELEKLQKNVGLPGMEEALPMLPETVDPDKVEGEMIKERIVTLVDASPHKAALILSDWLHEQKKKDGAAAGKDGAPNKTA